MLLLLFFCTRVFLPPPKNQFVSFFLYCEQSWTMVRILSPVSVPSSPVSSEFTEVRWMEDSLLWWALRPRQIGSRWSRVSLSAVKVSLVISLGVWGSAFPALSCLPWFRHLSDFPIISFLCGSKGNWRSVVVCCRQRWWLWTETLNHLRLSSCGKNMF